LIDAIEELARVLHPNAFNENGEQEKLKLENGARMPGATVGVKELCPCAL